MTKREKVIKGLECCTKVEASCTEQKCPYLNNYCCWAKLEQDALELLKEQEAFINRLYYEIKTRWNIIRQMPDASGEELKFLVDLLDRMEADGDEQEPPKEGNIEKLTDAEIKELMKAFDNAPIVLTSMVDAVPVKHGQWTTARTLEHDGEWYCSVCGYEPIVFENTPYCPKCGADMRGNE